MKTFWPVTSRQTRHWNHHRLTAISIIGRERPAVTLDGSRRRGVAPWRTSREIINKLHETSDARRQQNEIRYRDAEVLRYCCK